MHRRRVLQLAGSTLTAALAGCSVLERNRPSGVRVDRITIRNFLDRAVPVSVLLTADESIVRWRTVTVPGPPNPFAAIDDLPTDARPYVLYAEVPETDRDRPVRADLVEDAGDQPCIEVTIEVRDGNQNESTTPSVVYGTIGRCEPGSET